MFLMPSAACCSDTSLSLGTTGILGERGRDSELKLLRRLSCFACRCDPVGRGQGRFAADQRRAGQKGQIGGVEGMQQWLRLQIRCVVWDGR